MRVEVRTLVFPLLLAGCVWIAAGCGRAEQTRVEAAVAAHEQALLAGDAETALAFFTADYDDPWVPVETARERLRLRLSQKPLPTLTFGSREIFLRGDRAVVAERFTLEDQVEGRTRRYDELQHLMLKKSGRNWRCFAGSRVLGLLGGRMEAEAAIDGVMLQREAALVAKDLDAYMNLLTADYSFNNQGRAEVRAKLEGIFKLCDDIKFRSFERKTAFFGTAATVAQKYNMHYIEAGEERKIDGPEKFELIKTDTGWKFSKGI